MFSPLHSASFLCSFASRSMFEAFHSFPSASTHTCLLLHVSAVFPSYRCTSLWAEFVCAYACVCVSAACPSAISLWLSVFTSLCLIKHQTQPLRTAGLDFSANFPSLSLWLCVSVCQSACARRVLSASPLLHITLFPCIRHFPSFASSSSPIHLCSWEPKFPCNLLIVSCSLLSHIC